MVEKHHGYVVKALNGVASATEWRLIAAWAHPRADIVWNYEPPENIESANNMLAIDVGLKIYTLIQSEILPRFEKDLAEGKGT